MPTCSQQIIEDEEFPFDLDDDFDEPAPIKPPRYIIFIRGFQLQERWKQLNFVVSFYVFSAF